MNGQDDHTHHAEAAVVLERPLEWDAKDVVPVPANTPLKTPLLIHLSTPWFKRGMLIECPQTQRRGVYTASALGFAPARRGQVSAWRWAFEQHIWGCAPLKHPF